MGAQGAAQRSDSPRKKLGKESKKDSGRERDSVMRASVTLNPSLRPDPNPNSPQLTPPLPLTPGDARERDTLPQPAAPGQLLHPQPHPTP